MPRKKADIADKKKHLDFVYLTDQEYLQLCQVFGPDGAADWIEALNDYIGSKGDKYESHYYTIRVWARRAEKTTAAAIAGNKMLAARAADVVIEALKNPRHATMPEFTPQAHRAAYTALAKVGLSWPELKRRIAADPEDLAEFKEKFLAAYECSRQQTGKTI